jgi:hypothetical protein
MRSTFTLAAAVFATAASAQVFLPPRMPSDVARHPHSVAFFFTSVDWNTPGDPVRTGGVLAGDFSIQDKFLLGFWGARDQEDGTADMSWFDVHGTWLFLQQPNHVLGVTLGGLNVEIEGFDTASWGYIGLVGATRLDPNARRGSKWTLGYNLSGLSGQESGSGLFVTSDGVAYGVNVAYRMSESWQLGVAWWTMDLDNGTTINRSSLGAGLRF